MEKWLQIRDTNYSISSNGKVRNDKTGKIRVPETNERGYLRLQLYDHGLKTRERVHRLVAEAFIPNPDNLPEVNHLDGNKKNNNVDNLEWCTKSYNIKHSYTTGLRDPIHIEHKGTPVVCVNTDTYYRNINEASRQTGIPAKHISECIRCIRYDIGGLRFKYAT